MTRCLQSLSECFLFLQEQFHQNHAPETQELINFMLQEYKKETKVAGEAGDMVTIV